MEGEGGVRYVFFFKQKTAYEIKECDWSSDVCSSDLHILGICQLFILSQEDSQVVEGRCMVRLPGDNLPEIGRASCRERV